MQSCYHHSISSLRISSYIDRDTQGGYGRVGGWVGGGIMTFGTTYIMSLYHHHHIITQSSCHHHAISNLRISSYVDRDTQGGYGGLGGWDNNIRYGIHHVTLSSPSYHHAIIMQSLTFARTYPCIFVCGDGGTGTQVSMFHC